MQSLNAENMSNAKFERGKHVGKTGNCFIDDPFFNPWAPGGTFNQ